MKTLAKIDVGEGREAAILERDDGTTFWTPGTNSWVTFGQPQKSLASVPAGTLVAGDVPTGASTVQVPDATQTVVAGGKFIALVAGQNRRRELFVFFWNAGGEIVAPRREDELKRTQLDVEVRCPACDGLTWDRVEWRAPADASRARERALVCRTCGYADHVELIGRRRGPEPEHEYEDEPSPLSEDPTVPEILRAASFPLYVPSAPAAKRPRLGQYGWRAGRMATVTLTSGRLSVATMLAGEAGPFTPRDLAREQLRSELRSDLRRDSGDDWRDLPDDVWSLKRRELERPVEAAAGAARATSVSLRVEDHPVEFALVEHGGVWAASAQVDDHHVTIVGRDIDPDAVALRRLEPTDELASGDARARS